MDTCNGENPQSSGKEITTSKNAGYDTFGVAMGLQPPYAASGIIEKEDKQQLRQAIATDNRSNSSPRMQQPVNEREVLEKKLHAANSCRQSLNEEQDVAKAKQQATHEELTTINEALQRHNKNLKEQAYYAESIVQTIREALVVLHDDLRIRTVNKAFISLFKIQQADILSHFLYEIDNGILNIPELFAQLESSRFYGTDSRSFEIDHSFSTLGRRILLINATRMSTGSSRPKGLLLTIENITEQKLAEETKSLLSAIVSSSSEGILSFKKDLKISSWNKGAENMFGYTAAEMIGSSVEVLVPENRKYEPHKMIAQLLHNEAVKQYETTGKKKNGDLVPVELTLSPILNEQGGITAITALIRDISKRKKAEAESKELLAQVQRENAQKMEILESIGDGFYALDNKYRFTYINHKVEEVWNRRREELIGRHYWTEFPVLVGSLAYNMHLKVMAEKKPVFYENFSPLLNRWISVNIRPSESGGLAVYFHDIQNQYEIREAEQKLYTSAERFRAIVNQATACVAEMDLNGKFIFANQTFCAITGYTYKELMNTYMQDITLPDDLLHCRKLFLTTVKYGTPYVIEKRIIRKDGSVIWINNSVSGIRDEQDKAVSIVAVAIDVTKQKKSAELIHQAQERYRIALEAGGLSAWDWNLKTNKVICNEQHFALFGMEPEGLEKEPADFLQFFHPADVEYVLQEVANAVKKTGICEGEFRVIRKNDKAIRWMMGYGRVVEKEGKKSTRLTGVMYDITDRKIANEELKAAQASLNIALEASKMGVWDMDIKTGYIKRSARHDQMFGYTTLQENWNHEKAKAFIVAADKEKFDGGIEAMYATGNLDLEVRVQHPGGNICWIRYYGNVLYNEHREPLQAAGVIYEITDRKTIEKQKDEFIGIASHELKTPVTSIKAYAEMLYENFANSEDRQTATFLSKMNGQINRLTYLIRDLLDVTKISEGKLILNESDIDINKLLHDIADDIQRTTVQHHIVLDLDELPFYKGDKERLRQVFVNILSNAVKYSPEEDKIFIRTFVENDTINIAVEDLGIGMSVSTQGKLFERFFRSVDPDMVTFPGLGLGLYISMEIVKQHRGIIHVKSEKGKGSVFTVGLPLNDFAAKD